MDAMQGLTNAMTDMLGFFNAPIVQDLLVSLRPYLFVLLAIALAWLGFQLMMNRKIQTQQIVLNVLIAVLVLGGLAPTMTHFETFTKAANDFISTDGDGMMSDAVIKENLTDVAVYNQVGWSTTDLEGEDISPNNIQESRIRNIDMVQVMTDQTEVTPGEPLNDDGQEMMNHKVVTDAMGDAYVEEIDNGGMFSMFSYDEHYYRFEYNFWTIFVTLFVGAATLLFAGYKLARLCYEIAFNKILASILAFVDVQSGQMLKAVLKNIVNMFAIVIMIFLSLRMYNAFMAYLPTTDINPVFQLVAMIAVSAAVVDGPKICERIFGIDAGLRSGWGMVAGGYAMGKGAKGLTSGLTSLATKGVSGGAVAAAGLVGAASGLKGGKGNGDGHGSGGSPGGGGPSGSGGSGTAGSVQQDMKQTKDGQGQSKGLNAEGQPALHKQMNGNEKGTKQTGKQEGSAGQSGAPLHDDGKQNPNTKEGTQRGDTGTSSPSTKPSLHSDMKKGAQATGATAGAIGKAGIHAQAAPAMAATKAAGQITKAGAQPQAAQSNAPLHGSRETGSPSMPNEPATGASSSMSESNSPSQPIHAAPAMGAPEPLPGGDTTPQPADIPYQPPTDTQGPAPIESGGPVPHQPAPSQQLEQRTLGQYVGQKGREEVMGTKTYQRAKRSYDLSNNTTSNWKQTRINAKQLEAQRRQQNKQNRKRA